MLSTADILKQVRALEIKSKKITTQLFTGEYHSAFKGKGMSFREVREYSAGDDVRFIDWNVSARYAHPFSKVFEEERELVMMLLIDTSTSNLFGTVGKRKKDLITEMAATLVFSAINNNDKVIGKRHDVIGIKVYDKMDMTLPNLGLLQMKDAETGNTKWIDTSDAMVRHNYQQHFLKESDACKSNFRKAGAELLHVRTDEDYIKILQQFFLRRN